MRDQRGIINEGYCETYRRRELARMSMEPRTTSKGMEFSRPRPRVNESNEVGKTPQS
jgi:hypothetical protein